MENNTSSIHYLGLIFIGLQETFDLINTDDKLSPPDQEVSGSITWSTVILFSIVELFNGIYKLYLHMAVKLGHYHTD